MTALLGVPVVNATLEAWAKIFVFELELSSPVQVLTIDFLLERWAEPELEKRTWVKS